ncbi:MAG: hypothetical protein AAF721_16905 [Myxococcota bacterium]
MPTDERRLFTTPEPDAMCPDETHEVRCVEVSHDRALSYSLPVPRGMFSATSMRTPPLALHQSAPLGVFGLDRALAGPRLVVGVQTLRWDVDPLEWLRYGWITSGWRVVVSRVLPGPGGPRYEIGAIRNASGRHEVRRTLASRSGASLVRVDAVAPVEQWPLWHDRLWVSLDGFALGRSRRGTVEPLVTRDGPLLRFATPASWDARGSRTTHGGVQWVSQPSAGVQRGALLRVHAQPSAAADTTAARRTQVCRDVCSMGIELVRRLHAVPRPEFEALLPGFAGQWHVDGLIGGRSVELRIAQREQDGVAVDTVVLAPAPGTEHVDWMRATRAFDIAQSTTLVRPSDALTPPHAARFVAGAQAMQ